MAFRDHAVDDGAPCVVIGNIKNEKIVTARCPPGPLAALANEFEMIGASRKTDHDAIKPFMILKAAKSLKTQAVHIEFDDRFQFIGRPSDAQGRTFQSRHRVFSFTHSRLPITRLH